MIHLHKIRELNLTTPSSAGRLAHLSAASGLVQSGDFLYVIADDEYHLGVFSATVNTPGNLLALFPGELPVEKEQRKALKPDLETLTLLPPCNGYPNGALLALGSGSRPNRQTGVLIALDAQGGVVGAPRLIDFAQLYDALRQQFADVNIEGAVINGNNLILLQRGNKKTRQNALIEINLGALFQFINGADTAEVTFAIQAKSYDLGEFNGIPLGFTDAAALPHGDMVFTAVAEDTQDSYHDGACGSAAVGIIQRNGALCLLEPLDKPYKIEGVSARIAGDTIRLLLVTDADDSSIPASLLAADVPGYPFDMSQRKKLWW